MKLVFGQPPIERELQRLNTEERRYLKKRQAEKPHALTALLEEKVPDKLQETLNTAFAGAFSLMFQKGTGVIEKTYNREKLEEESRDGQRRILCRQDRRSLRTVTERAEGSGLKNLLISGAAGIGMGAVGAGIPDIPVFTAMMLKSIYEIALEYGFDYHTEAEKYFILLLIQGAMADWDELQEIEEKLDVFMESELLPLYYSRDGQIHRTAASLSRELLYLKFLQGVPVVGIVGGVYDMVYMKRITEYAELKYRRRFYEKMVRK